MSGGCRQATYPTKGALAQHRVCQCVCCPHAGARAAIRAAGRSAAAAFYGVGWVRGELVGRVTKVARGTQGNANEQRLQCQRKGVSWGLVGQQRGLRSKARAGSREKNAVNQQNNMNNTVGLAAGRAAAFSSRGNGGSGWVVGGPPSPSDLLHSMAP